MTIVSDLEQLETTVLDQDFDSSGASVNRVLEQLLESVHRRHDDFSSSNLVDDIFR